MPPAFHSAMERRRRTATMATPPAASRPPNKAPRPETVPQSPVQPMPTRPKPMAAPERPATTTATKAPMRAPRLAKAGLGSAYREGFKLGLAQGYEALVEMDADLSHDPSVLADLLAELEG